MRPSISFAAFAAATSLLAAGAVHAAASPVVTIGNFTFGPMTVEIPVGGTVTWINADDVPHTVVAADTKTFRSRPIDSDEHYAFTFTKPGVYSYFCSLHPKMTGRIIVR